MRRALVAFAALLAFGLPAAPATAARGVFLSFGSLGRGQSEFQLRGSHGYFISLAGAGRRVVLTAFDKDGFVSYTVRGRASTSGIRARFGNRGRIAVEFRPSGKVKRHKPPKRCTGEPRITRFGTFVGTIKFRGERHYTAVDASGARGETNTSPDWKCKPRHGGGKLTGPKSEGGSGSVELTALEAISPAGLSFGAATIRLPEESGLTSFSAGLQESRGNMQVSRLSVASAPERTFVFDEADLSSATVTPPPPFRGSATYQRNPDGSVAWTGSLRVSLPGTASVALVGPRFKVRLRHFSFGRAVGGPAELSAWLRRRGGTAGSRR